MNLTLSMEMEFAQETSKVAMEHKEEFISFLCQRIRDNEEEIKRLKEAIEAIERR